MPSDPEYLQNHRTLLYVNMQGKYNAELGIIQLCIYYLYDDAGVQSTRYGIEIRPRNPALPLLLQSEALELIKGCDNILKIIRRRRIGAFVFQKRLTSFMTKGVLGSDPDPGVSGHIHQ